MGRKDKLLEKLKSKPKSFTWDEAKAVMTACGFDLMNARGGGSGRMFVNRTTKQKVRLHEPHPQNTLLPYMLDALIDALKDAGEIES